MICFFDTYHANKLDGINKELEKLQQSSTFLGVVNIETHSQYTRVWYRTQITIPGPYD